MIYEFECPRGHVTSELVPMGTAEIVCPTCLEEIAEIGRNGGIGAWNPVAKRILSPTGTTFRFADRRD